MDNERNDVRQRGKRAREEQVEQGEPTRNERRKQPLFCFGNYARYYGYRREGNGAEAVASGAAPQSPPQHNQHQQQASSMWRLTRKDDRLAALDASWIRKETVLDVGCHEGLVTLEVARRFDVTKVVGIDIDESLVTRAIHNLIASRSASRNHENMTLAPVTFRCENYAMSTPGVRGGSGANADLEASKYPATTDVKHGAPPYGVILMLSMTKWVHMNFGDDGIRRLFSRARDELRPGGVLVLEAQTYESYTKAVKAVKKMRHLDSVYVPLKQLKLHPDEFSRVLTTDYGFETLALPQASRADDASAASTTEFSRRNLLVFRKPMSATKVNEENL